MEGIKKSESGANFVGRMLLWAGYAGARLKETLTPPTARGVTPTMTPPTDKTRAFVHVRDNFDLIEILPGDDPVFSREQLVNAFCLDLDKFSVADAITWITSARRNTIGALPRLVVVSPTRKLSSDELSHISDDIAPLAVFSWRRPIGCKSFENVLDALRNKISSVSAPNSEEKWHEHELAAAKGAEVAFPNS